ncbi:hypothetical protein BASA81_012735 [Batrachochytrium salamandrivorans]|nr:hypothetical protein BASA81_012735 [Batrachochytrium salamandrivorans]
MKAIQSFRELVGEDKSLKRRIPKFTEVNANRIMLFDFVASKEYPEQVTVRAGEVVFVFEAYPDGWCEVKTGGRIGVIPTAYHGPVPDSHRQRDANGGDAAPTLTRQQDEVLKVDATEKRSAQLKRQATGLGRMAKDKFWERMLATALLLVEVVWFVVMGLIVPLISRLYRIASKNENKSTTLSFLTRIVFESVCLMLIPMLTDHELLAFDKRLQEDAARVKAETVYRRANDQGSRLVKTMSAAAM